MALRLLYILLAWALVSILSAGCAYQGAAGAGPYYGPPPHAPAHGHRHPYGDDIVLVYDGGLGLYMVYGRPHYYFDNGWYWRRYHNSLEISLSLGGPWRSYKKKFRHPPPGLAKKYGYPYRLPPGHDRKHR